jgi:hypothetical protein
MDRRNFKLQTSNFKKPSSTKPQKNSNFNRQAAETAEAGWEGKKMVAKDEERIFNLLP